MYPAMTGPRYMVKEARLYRSRLKGWLVYDRANRLWIGQANGPKGITCFISLEHAQQEAEKRNERVSSDIA